MKRIEKKQEEKIISALLKPLGWDKESMLYCTIDGVEMSDLALAGILSDCCTDLINCGGTDMSTHTGHLGNVLDRDLSQIMRNDRITREVRLVRLIGLAAGFVCGFKHIWDMRVGRELENGHPYVRRADAAKNGGGQA